MTLVIEYPEISPRKPMESILLKSHVQCSGSHTDDKSFSLCNFSAPTTSWKDSLCFVDFSLVL